jgi:hypothetical protein
LGGVPLALSNVSMADKEKNLYILQLYAWLDSSIAKNFRP